MRILKAGIVYFALVFAAGFLPGPVRISWVVPRVCTRIAELMETPIMLAVTIVKSPEYKVTAVRIEKGA